MKQISLHKRQVLLSLPPRLQVNHAIRQANSSFLRPFRDTPQKTSVSPSVWYTADRKDPTGWRASIFFPRTTKLQPIEEIRREIMQQLEGKGEMSSGVSHQPDRQTLPPPVFLSFFLSALLDLNLTPLCLCRFLSPTPNP